MIAVIFDPRYPWQERGTLLRARLEQEYPGEEIVIQAIRHKQELLSFLHAGPVSGLHFLFDFDVYGPVMGSPDYPEPISALEWSEAKITFENDAQVWCYQEKAALWFAPWWAAHYHVPVQVQDWGCKVTQVISPQVFGESADYDAIAELYGRVFEDFKVRRDEWAWIRSCFRQDRSLSVLDIGCGNGAVLSELASTISEGVGVDISGPLLDIATKRQKNTSHLKFHQLTGALLPFPEKSFDRVLSVLSFRYLDWDPMIEEIKRVLKPDGRVLILDMVSHQPAPWEWPRMILDSIRSRIQKWQNPRYSRALQELVSHPDWKKMLRQHPIRSYREYRSYLFSRFPRGRMRSINIGLKSRIIAFDSGPAGQEGEQH